jgi:HSP20 family protein
MKVRVTMFRRINSFRLPVHHRNLFDMADDLFSNEFFDFMPTLEGNLSANRFKANVWEKEDTYFLSAELPGLLEDSLSIEVKGRELEISAQRDAGPEGVSYLVRERAAGRINQTFRFSRDIDKEKVEATYKNGILTIKMPVAEEAKPRKIAINF